MIVIIFKITDVVVREAMKGIEKISSTRTYRI